MSNKQDLHFDSLVIHAAQETEQWMDATHPPIVQSASHRYETAEQLSEVFAGKQEGHLYSRLSNPTNRALEEKLRILEGGRAALVTSSGMAAVSVAVMAILRADDELVAGRSLFMSTYLLFSKVLPKYGIRARLAKPTDLDAVEAAITDKTRLVYVEAIGNPAMDVPHIKSLADLAHRHGLPLLIDSTLATPYLFRPLDLGADVVIHSTTKYFNGHGSAVGGAIIDAGNFDWPEDKYPDFSISKQKRPDSPFLDKAWREMHINLGTTQAPFNSYLTILGLNTLGLRMERHQKNAHELARHLSEHPKVSWVNYPGLPEHPSHETAKQQFQGKGFGALLTFGLENQKQCFEFIDRLKLAYHLANLGDCKTLVIHPYSSQYISFDPAARLELGILPEMIRVSVGIEHIGDIIDDFEQALEGI